MPSETVKTAQRLLDIVENIDAAIKFTTGMTQDEFAADLRSFYATLRALEIISEASRNLPEELRDRQPQISWRSIRDAGNVYRHEYPKVLPENVWDTVARLAPLRAAAIAELVRLGYGHLVEKP